MPNYKSSEFIESDSGSDDGGKKNESVVKSKKKSQIPPQPRPQFPLSSQKRKASSTEQAQPEKRQKKIPPKQVEISSSGRENSSSSSEPVDSSSSDSDDEEKDSSVVDVSDLTARPTSHSQSLPPTSSPPGSPLPSTRNLPPEPYSPPQGFEPLKSLEQSTAQSLFSASHLGNKQIWHISAPASIPVHSLSSFTMDQITEGRRVIKHSGASYAFVKGSEKGQNEPVLLLPDGKDGMYRPASLKFSKTLDLQQIIESSSLPYADSTGGSEAAARVTIPEVRQPRPQPQGLRTRFWPVGFEPAASFRSSLATHRTPIPSQSVVSVTASSKKKQVSFSELTEIEPGKTTPGMKTAETIALHDSSTDSDNDSDQTLANNGTKELDPQLNGATPETLSSQNQSQASLSNGHGSSSQRSESSGKKSKKSKKSKMNGFSETNGTPSSSQKLHSSKKHSKMNGINGTDGVSSPKAPSHRIEHEKNGEGLTDGKEKKKKKKKKLDMKTT